jgi:hypothetical protein
MTSAPYGQSNFGWNLGSAPQAAPPPYPMPQAPSQNYPVYPPSNSYPSYPQQNNDPGDPGIEEVVSPRKDAGSGSFAHYILKWVSDGFKIYSRKIGRDKIDWN